MIASHHLVDLHQDVVQHATKMNQKYSLMFVIDLFAAWWLPYSLWSVKVWPEFVVGLHLHYFEDLHSDVELA